MLPTKVLLLPVIIAPPALYPISVLSQPLCITLPALPLASPDPKITFREPVVKKKPVYGPIAILYEPVVSCDGKPQAL